MPQAHRALGLVALLTAGAGAAQPVDLALAEQDRIGQRQQRVAGAHQLAVDAGPPPDPAMKLTISEAPSARTSRSTPITSRAAIERSTMFTAGDRSRPAALQAAASAWPPGRAPDRRTASTEPRRARTPAVRSAPSTAAVAGSKAKPKRRNSSPAFASRAARSSP